MHKKKITKIKGQVIPLAMDDVDTDMIIPAQFLVGTTRQGYGKHLFRRLRDSEAHFVFNQERFSRATVLVTQKNFGCGSSREHAVWGLIEAGIQVVIAESFPDLFYANSAKNGLLLIQQPQSVVAEMIHKANKTPYFLEIDLKQQSIKEENQTYFFRIDPFNQYCFLNGLDQLDYLQGYAKEIDTWKKTSAPYLAYSGEL